MNKIPFLELKEINSKYIDDITQHCEKTIRSGWYVNGTQKKQFEENLARYNKLPYAIGTSNGYDSLRLIFKSLIITGKLKIGDHVIVPSNSFVASALAISENGLIPEFVDVNKDDFLICQNSLIDKTTNKVKAILIVHLYGQICWSNELKQIIERHNLIVIEDNAQAIGAELNGVKSGAIGLASAFSFYPGKNLGAMGDGGAICTKDLELYQIIKAASNYGASNKYTHDILGDNCRLDEIQAAVLNIKLPHLNDENTKRRSIAKKYDEGIRNESIQLPKLPSQQLSHVWHLYVIQVENRNDFQEYMNLNGIETMIHYPIPIHKQQAYKKYNDINLINCETVQCKIVSIPLNSCLDHQSVEYIISTMNKYQIN
mgnify:FL=1